MIIIVILLSNYFLRLAAFSEQNFYRAATSSQNEIGRFKADPFLYDKVAQNKDIHKRTK